MREKKKKMEISSMIDLLGGMEFEFYSKRHLRVRSRSDLSRGAVFKVRMVTE